MRRSKRIASGKVIAIVLGGILVWEGNAAGGVITLGGYCTLEYAIEAANTDAPSLYCAQAGSGADLIVLTRDETFDRAWEGGGSATPVVTSEIVIDGMGYEILRVSNLAEYRLFHVAAGGDLTIINAYLKDGRAPSNDGGAILNEGTLRVENSQFWNNSAGWFGGAIASDGTLTVEDVFFFSNSTTLSGSRGGAISNGARCPLVCTATVTRTEFLENTSGQGGGLFNGSSSFLFVNDSFFDDNSVTGGRGGGIYNRGSAMVGRSLFYDNFASNGSALCNDYGAATITNSTFAFNLSNNTGAVENLDGTLTIRQSTFSNNTAQFVHATSSGVGGSAGDTTEVGGSIFDGNTGAPDCDANVSSLGFNFGCGSTAPTNVASTLSWNGGYTKVIELLSGSNAIDTGGSCGYGIDQRGVERDDPCESGAFEWGRCEDEHLAGGSIGGILEEEACEFLFASDVTVTSPSGDLTLRAGSRVSIWNLTVEEGASLSIELDATLLP
jgi:predicted outer membrane repeat protein